MSQPKSEPSRLPLFPWEGRKGESMHYYQHHIGDFIKATARMTDGQTMAYLRMLWMYYDSERPLPDNSKILSFQLGASQEDVELLLITFFTLEDDGWHQSRCDQEIDAYRSFLDKKSNAGRASAERRKNSSSTGVEQVLNGCLTAVQLTTNQQPLTTNQKKKREMQRGTRLHNLFEFPQAWVDFCSQTRPELNPQETFEQFRDYWVAQPGQKGVKTDWEATWRNWVRRQQAPKKFASEQRRDQMAELTSGLSVPKPKAFWLPKTEVLNVESK
jgi:uncharacterized protein YdaU (DUF1376 family)